MNILISHASNLPIYQQIYDQLRQMILSGQLSENEMLPSIRLLAKELRISVITTKRAYDELERDGFLVSVPGKGSFVAGANLDFIREEHLKEMEGMLRRAIKAGKLAGLDYEEIEQALRIIGEEK